MGTRNLIALFHEGKYKVAQYGQWDGYPEGQGVDVLAFLHGLKNREDFLRKVDECIIMDEPTLKKLWQEAGADETGWIAYADAQFFNKNYPSLSRDTGAKIFTLIDKANDIVPLRLQLHFAGDGLFCEWAYVVDFDKNTFEVYKGFSHTISPDERFAFLAKEGEEYAPVNHVHTFMLDDLPTEKEFLRILVPQEADA